VSVTSRPMRKSGCLPNWSHPVREGD
jgi:hypothetical protein